MRILFLCFVTTSLMASNSWKPKYQESEKILESITAKKSSKKIQAKKKVTKKRTKKSTTKKVSKAESKELQKLRQNFRVNHKTKKGLSDLKKQTLALKQKSVPILVDVMKRSDYPDKNRWLATFLLGRIMGVKSADFISKFVKHPNFLLRLASLKTLLALKQDQYHGLYVEALKDKAMIVRFEALELIRKLKIKKLAPYVWSMLYDKSNYAGSVGKRKRTNIIKTAIKTMGDLGFAKAKEPMLSMMQKKKYKDIYPELDYSLNLLSKNSSPKGSYQIKQRFWKRQAVAEKVIR